MDQKNTIVKCKAHPDCLFNHNGVCDNYVININADGKCECYVETELVENVIQDPVKIGLAFKEISKQMDMQRGQRAKCNLYEDACDDKIAIKMKVAELNKPNKNKSTIKGVVPECDLPVCNWSCKHALRSGPTFNPDLWCDKMKGKPAVGLFCSEYEEEK